MEAGSEIREATERIVQAFDPTRVLLFGSRARVEGGAASDLDLFVVLPRVEDKREAAVRIRRLLNGLPAAKDIVVTTPEEIEQRGHLVGPVLRPALRDGKVLYEKAAGAR